MDSRKLGDWLQLIAALGVIVGLGLVAYEIREANRVAKAEAVRNIYDGFSSVANAAIESEGLMDLYVKSWDKPDDLSPAEVLKLSAYFERALTEYNKHYDMHTFGVARYDGVDDLVAEFDHWFGSKFGRAWYWQNKHWFRQPLVDAIESEMQKRPIRIAPPEVEEIRSRLQ